jgi:hypothetical protein
LEFLVNTRARTLALVAAAAVSTTAIGAVPASAATPAAKITGGNVQIALNSKTLKAVRGHGIAFAPLGKATLRNGTLKFPVTGGTLTGSNYRTKLDGGFTYSKNGHWITVTHIVMDTATHKATADVTGHGNIDVFILGDPQSGSGGPGKVSYGGYPVKLTGVLTRAVDKALSTSVVANNPAFGIGETTVTF